MLLLSLGVAAMAYTGRLDSDIFGYRLLPGTLYIFLVGASFQVPVGSRQGRRLAWLRGGVLLVAMLLAGLAIARPAFGALHYNIEVYLGLGGGILMLTVLHRRPSGRWDNLLGNLSYGVFLDHNLIVWTYKHLLGRTTLGAIDCVIILMIAVCLAWLAYTTLERPALRWRHAFRRRHQVGAAAAL